MGESGFFKFKTGMAELLKHVGIRLTLQIVERGVRHFPMVPY
jgi:hypothetical protein